MYTVPGGEEIRRDEIGSDPCRLIAVGVLTTDAAGNVSVELAEQGVELIEFCGAFGAAQIAAVQRAMAGFDIPVGVVTYGGDAASGLHRPFADAHG